MQNSNVGGRNSPNFNEIRDGLEDKGLQFGETIVKFFRFISGALKYLLFSIIVIIKTLFEYSMLNGFVGLFSLMLIILAADNYYRAMTGLSLAPFYVDDWVGWDYWIPKLFYFLPIIFKCFIDSFFWLAVVFMLMINSIQTVVVRMYFSGELKTIEKGQAILYLAIAGLMYIIEIGYTFAGRVSYEAGDLLSFGFGAHAAIMLGLSAIIVLAPEIVSNLALNAANKMMTSK